MESPLCQKIAIFSGLVAAALINVALCAKFDNAQDAVIYADEGRNVSLICPNASSNVNWIVSDTIAKQKLRSRNSAVQDDGTLSIFNLTNEDSHLYTCQDAETNQSLGSLKLVVRTVPPAVSNLTVLTHTVYAFITWDLHGNGGYPLERYILKFRRDETESKLSTIEWKVIDDVKANTTSVTVYQLEPNSTYYFRLQAVNRIGPGHEVTVMAKTKFSAEEIREANEQSAFEHQGSPGIFMKATVVAICLVVITCAILSLGISLVLFRHCGKNVHTELNGEATEEEVMELVPHITLNPSFNIDMLEYIEAEVSPTDACEKTSLVKACNESSNRRGPIM